VNGVGQYQPFVEGLPKSSPSLDAEQQAALSHLLRSRDFITLFRGAAGTGKSYVLRELVSGLRDQGWSVTVLAPQRQQVVELEQAGFSGLTTLADFLIKRPPIRGGVVVVDEAGQIGARQMLDLIQHARSCGGRLILSGDTRQHGPVEASDALVALEHQAHLRPAQLETIKRQDPQLAATRQEQAFIAAYREAVQAAAVGRSRESFDRLDRMGVVVECGPGEQPDRLVREYLELTDKGYSTLIVSQTWSEVHRVNQQIRASLKEKGLIGNQEQRVAALDRVDLTAAQKRDARFYGPDSILLFNRKVRHGPAGATGRFVAALPEGVLVDAGQRVVTVPICHLDHITVCRPLEVTIAEGDRLQLKANRRLQGGSSVANGELVTVRQLRSDGHIELVDGRVLDPGYRQFAPGYAVTSYGSQGKTVDFVLFSDSAVKTATSDQQWYVTISRGRRGIRIFTPDKEQLRENVVCPGRRKLALEIASPLTARQRVLGRWFKRFGRRVSGPMLAARHACRFYRNRKETYEHQTARVLVT
jgi:ATP-dependent exoDNAse (exonuclease V) alpha subunit